METPGYAESVPKHALGLLRSLVPAFLGLVPGSPIFVCKYLALVLPQRTPDDGRGGVSWEARAQRRVGWEGRMEGRHWGNPETSAGLLLYEMREARCGKLSHEREDTQESQIEC